MRRLDMPFPFGINARNWPWFVLIFASLLRLASLADAPVSQALQSLPAPIVFAFAQVTLLGVGTWILIPALVLTTACALASLLVRDLLGKLGLVELARLFGFVFVSVGVAGLLANLLKRAIGRSRPVLFDTVGAFDFHHFANTWTYEAFPSGHTTTIFAFAVALGFLWPRLYRAALAVAIVVGLSRIVVGMHYPTDVIGGFACGVIVAWVVRNAFAARGWVFSRRRDGTVVARLPAVRKLIAGARSRRA
jgi:undecaprenyl-diphosphatase